MYRQSIYRKIIACRSEAVRRWRRVDRVNGRAVTRLSGGRPHRLEIGVNSRLGNAGFAEERKGDGAHDYRARTNMAKWPVYRRDASSAWSPNVCVVERLLKNGVNFLSGMG
jgi:hypothetical protein